MFFWFKKSKVVLDCFTYSDFAYDFAKIEKSSKYFPEWWRKTPKIHNDELTIKNCYAFINYYKTGIVIPSWFEMKFNIFKDKLDDGSPRYSWITSHPHMGEQQSHTNNQFHLFTESNSCNFKLSTVWKMKTKDEIYFTWTQPTWNNKFMLKYMSILPGVMEFKHQPFAEINYLVHEQEKDVSFEIPAQTPLVMLHPITEKEVHVVNHMIDKTEWDRIGHLQGLVFQDSMEDRIKMIRKKKKIIEQVERKCPFGHD